ncbi:MAG: hypothetical protein JSW23_10270 [Planctomycetota bacterium]|nr:MAG: hypothetical protein JSW23_10270 [Planctomycetota bacterium]
MKPKTILTIALLLFVGGSVAYLINSELRPRPEPAAPTASAPESADAALTVSQSPKAAASKVVVYYFHGNARCTTCRKFEQYTLEALQDAFPEQLNDGSLQWQMVNVENPGNEHYVKDYQLYTKSIVLAKTENGKPAGWKNLKEIWELVRRKPAFVQYIQDEVRNCLESD